MTRGLKVIRDLSRGVSTRTVQVTVVPTPVKFQERRAVLHALQKFAHIEVFQKLDNHDASFVSVSRNDSSAADLVQRSPLEYHLMTGESQSRGAIRAFLTSAPSTDPILQRPSATAAHQTTDRDPNLTTLDYEEETPSQAQEEAEAQADNTQNKKHFTVHIFPFPEYVHASAIRASPLHGPWEEPRQRTAASSELLRSMPGEISAEGLSDWDSGGQNADMAKSKMVEDLLFGHKAMDPGKRALKERLLRGEKKKKMPAVMEGLLHLQRQREEEDAHARGKGRNGSAQPGT